MKCFIPHHFIWLSLQRDNFILKILFIFINKFIFKNIYIHLKNRTQVTQLSHFLSNKKIIIFLKMLELKRLFWDVLFLFLKIKNIIIFIF